jgi:hypothetical protein
MGRTRVKVQAFWISALNFRKVTASSSSCSSNEYVRGRLPLICDGTRAETRFLLSAKRTSPFQSVGTSVQLTTGSLGVRISGSNAGYTMFRGSVKSTSYPLHSSVSPSLPLPCVTACHHISTGLYLLDRYYAAGLDVLVTNSKIPASAVNRGVLQLVALMSPLFRQ